MWHWYDKGEEWLAIMLLGGTSLTMLVSSTARAIGNPFAGGAELAQFLFIWTAVLGLILPCAREARCELMPLSFVYLLSYSS